MCISFNDGFKMFPYNLRQAVRASLTVAASRGERRVATFPL